MQKSEKTTDEILHEIKNTHEINEFLEKNDKEFEDKPIHQLLDELLASTGLKKADVIKKSGIERIYGYQIFSGKRVPSRDKLVAICVGFQLDIDKTNKLLNSAGYPTLYARNKRDAIIIFAINEQNDVMKLNELLFDAGLDVI